MAFVKIYPLSEMEQASPDGFGKGNPARCLAERRFSAREYVLNVDHILAFEECPLYLVCDRETDALVNGIRIRLVTGEFLVVPDDPEDGQPGFVDTLRRVRHGDLLDTSYSRYLLELERNGLI